MTGNNMMTTATGGLSADFASKLVKGIAESRSTLVLAGGTPLLRLLKDGLWVFGQENLDVEPGSRWAVNPTQLAHGWSCWVNGAPGQKNTLAGEVMTPMWDAKPPRPAPSGGTPFAEQMSMALRCMDGTDKGTDVLYKTASHGGLTALDALRVTIQGRLQEPGGLDYPCPVLTLDKTHYQHPQWGKTYKPVLTIVGWCSMQGVMEPDQAPAVTQGPVPADFVDPLRGVDMSMPAHRNRHAARPADAPAAAAAPVAPAQPQATVEPPPASTTQARVGQRRRPAAR